MKYNYPVKTFIGYLVAYFNNLSNIRNKVRIRLLQVLQHNIIIYIEELRHFLVNNLVYSIKELYELMKNERFCKLTRFNYNNY